MTIPVLLASRYPAVVCGLTKLLQQEQDLEIVATCRKADLVIAAVREWRASVAIVDRDIGDGSDLAVLEQLSATSSARVVLLCRTLTADKLLDVLRLGAAGVVRTEMPPALFAECIRAVHEGKQWVEPELLALTLETLFRRESGAREVSLLLTPREIMIACILAAGSSNKEIAARLRISEGTVKTHLHSIYKKLPVDGRQDLMQYVLERGFKAA